MNTEILDEFINFAIEMRDKHGHPADTSYKEGQWDMAQRLIGWANKKRNQLGELPPSGEDQ